MKEGIQKNEIKIERNTENIQMLASLFFLRHQMSTLEGLEKNELISARKFSLDVITNTLHFAIQEHQNTPMEMRKYTNNLNDIKMAQIGGYQWLSELDETEGLEDKILRSYLLKGLSVMEDFSDKYESKLV